MNINCPPDSKDDRRSIVFSRDYVTGGAEGAFATPEFGGSEKRTERETDNLLLIASPDSKS